jgi:hypothetical protein
LELILPLRSNSAIKNAGAGRCRRFGQVTL